MLEFLYEYGLFLAQSITVVMAILMSVGGVLALLKNTKGSAQWDLDIQSVNEKYNSMKLDLYQAIMTKDELKAALKEEKKQQKLRQTTSSKRLFVLDFLGDIRASSVNDLRETISAILTVINSEDKVLMRLESAGGHVHAYGLAASQLARLKAQGVSLTIAVDKIAASGGYMMACVADHIIAAPFAILGSIGVLGQAPNFHRLLKKHNVDFEQHAAGQYKQTLSVFGENTDSARTKFKEELEDTHELFKQFVIQHRGQVDIQKVATGEHWYGTRALQHHLIDELKTSDDYLLEACEYMDVYEVEVIGKKTLLDRISSTFAAASERLFFTSKV